MELVNLVATPRWRFLRILVGLILFWIGTYVLSQPLGHWIQAFALIPIVSGVFNVFLLAPLVGAPVKGSELT